MRSRSMRHATHRVPSLALVGGWLLVGIVAGACDWSDERVDRTSPLVVPGESPSSGGQWGPLAVVPPQGGADSARNEGTLRIAETCVVLETRGGPVLLVWPADRTTWNVEDRSIAFANYDGSTETASDGAYVVVGGSGDSFEESGLTTEAWLARTPWVARPNASCPLEARWWVGALTR